MATKADLVVEDGSGLDNANTYVSIDDGNTYHALRGNSAWTAASEGEKATALVHATQYVDTRWSFIGELTNPATASVVGQALAWPRMDDGVNLLDSRGNEVGMDEVPVWVVNATLEYALAYLTTGRLLPDPEVPDDAGRFVSLKREKVGPIEEETRYSDTRGTRIVKKYALADAILRSSGLVSGGANSRAVRA